MDPHLLTTFLAVRKHKNFTRAAEELSLSQPAVSRQIQQLERELGMPVFDRLGKALHVTDAGETLAAEGQKLLRDLEELMEAVRRHESPGTGTLRIGAGTTAGLYLLPPVLGAFRRKHPDVEVSYAIERSDNIIERVLRNEIDLGFVGCPVEDRAIVSEPIAEDQIVCFAGPRHSAVGRSPRDIEVLLDETWIVRPPGSATRALFDSWLASRKCALKRTVEIGCPEGIRALVAAGVGLSYMSVHAVSGELRRRRLVQMKSERLAPATIDLGHSACPQARAAARSSLRPARPQAYPEWPRKGRRNAARAPITAASHPCHASRARHSSSPLPRSLPILPFLLD